MLIRKNTKAFKTIKEIITSCRERDDRKQLIRLYITRAGNSVADRVSVESIEGDHQLFYDMTYDTITINLESSERQLYESDDVPGIYYFHSPSNKLWDETPFEFDIAVKEVFSALSDLPVVRKKEKIAKYVFPVAKKSHTTQNTKNTVDKKKAVKPVARGPRQPHYHLKQAIEFTELDRVIFQQPRVTKKEVLDYYNAVADYLLPHLKNRPLCISVVSHGRTTDYTNLDLLSEDVELPEWMERTGASQPKGLGRAIQCESKEQLLWYVEIGCIQFSVSLSRMKAPSLPDYIIFDLSAANDKHNALIEAALTAKTIFSGLQLTCCLKAKGKSGLHIYVPLDGSTDFVASKAAAAYISKLIRLKASGQVAMEGTDDTTHGKIIVSHLCNGQQEYVVAPYSLIDTTDAIAALPLLWEDLEDGLKLNELNHETAIQRVRKVGDPFGKLSKKKINAEKLLQRLQEYYSFLL